MKNSRKDVRALPRSLVLSLLAVTYGGIHSACANPGPLGGGAPASVAVTRDASPSVDSTSNGLDAEEAKFLSTLNAYRARNGLSPVRVSPKLNQAAEWMSKDMAAGGYLNHTDEEGRSPFQRMSAYGYSMVHTGGENIACGNATAAATFEQWRTSPGHNANMLNPQYREIGIARATSPNASAKGRMGCGWYWTTDFGG